MVSVLDDNHSIIRIPKSDKAQTSLSSLYRNYFVLKRGLDLMDKHNHEI